jgi:ADP-heptose:LPS heptosyltransferase
MTPCDAGCLVLFPGALGDAVCLEPAIAHLAASMPVTVHARGGAAEVAAHFPSPVTVRSLDTVEIARLFGPEDDPRTTAWLAEYSRIVSFTGAEVPAVVRRLQATGRAIVVRFPRPPLAEHAADLFLRAVGGEVAGSAAVPRLVPPKKEPLNGGPPLLALLPGSGGRDKRVPAEIHALLARRWQLGGGEVVTVLGPAEADEDEIWRTLGRIVRPPSIRALVGVLAWARGFVGNDSGPSHVAAALGTPGVVLYTATVPWSFGPRGAAVTSVTVSTGDAGATADRAWQELGPRLP